ncbi:MAG: hypothetical protein IJS49_05065 [Paludibacteraceae bacterium]|nr:hypothetical protein [Paludibacteraceae bacterium]
MKTVEELIKEQEALHQEIDRIAESLDNGLSPIYDGVGNIDIYLSSPLKIMWLVKESYDQDKQGNKGTGNWSIYDAVQRDTAWSYLSFQRMTYALYGYNNGIYYEGKDMPMIRDHKEMVKDLANIAYININKLPGGTSSSDSHIASCYKIWNKIIDEQIEVYNPDVIILGGTKKFLDFRDELIPCKQYDNNDVNPKLSSNVYKWGSRWIISVCHPGYRMSTEVYVDLVIDSLRYVAEQLKIHK